MTVDTATSAPATAARISADLTVREIAVEHPTFTIGEVARLIGVTKDAIRKAEKQQRVAPVQREQGGDDRVFYAEDIDRLRRYFRR